MLIFNSSSYTKLQHSIMNLAFCTEVEVSWIKEGMFFFQKPKPKFSNTQQPKSKMLNNNLKECTEESYKNKQF